MSDEILENSGRTKLGIKICGDNTVNYWTRNERGISHIMVEEGLSTNLAFIEERMTNKAIII